MRVAKYNLFVSAFMALVTTLLAICAYMQWKEMNASVNAMKKSIELTQASERPYVGIDQIVLDKLSVGHMIIIKLNHKNFGKSPAMNTRIRSKILLVTSETSDNFNFINNREMMDRSISSTVMWPGHGMHIITSSKEAISNNNYKMVRDKKAIIFIFGFIDYESIHGKKYETTFCSTYSPESGLFQAYKKYNSVIELE